MGCVKDTGYIVSLALPEMATHTIWYVFEMTEVGSKAHVLWGVGVLGCHLLLANICEQGFSTVLYMKAKARYRLRPVKCLMHAEKYEAAL